jgi:hypothetical protein
MLGFTAAIEERQLALTFWGFCWNCSLLQEPAPLSGWRSKTSFDDSLLEQGIGRIIQGIGCQLNSAQGKKHCRF